MIDSNRNPFMLLDFTSAEHLANFKSLIIIGKTIALQSVTGAPAVEIIQEENALKKRLFAWVMCVNCLQWQHRVACFIYCLRRSITGMCCAEYNSWRSLGLKFTCWATACWLFTMQHTSLMHELHAVRNDANSSQVMSHEVCVRLSPQWLM